MKDSLFIPKNRTFQHPKSWPSLVHQPGWSHTPVVCNSPGYITPMPEPSESMSLSPAWDPSSSTPRHEPDPNRSSPDHPSQESIQHVLLNPQLINIRLRVVVTGGKYTQRELIVLVCQSTNGSLTIRHPIYNTLEFLEPKWVTLKHPNPTRDNGLLVIVEGNHCGKFVWRIYHRYADQKALVLVGVVNRVAGQTDTLTGEKLELDSSALCVCEESKEEKKLNVSLMDTLWKTHKVHTKWCISAYERHNGQWNMHATCIDFLISRRGRVIAMKRGRWWRWYVCLNLILRVLTAVIRGIFHLRRAHYRHAILHFMDMDENLNQKGSWIDSSLDECDTSDETPRRVWELFEALVYVALPS